jgi:glutamate dehydrogenase
MVLSTVDVWLDDLRSQLVGRYGTARGEQVFSRYVGAFSTSYCEAFSTGHAIADISVLEDTSVEGGRSLVRLPQLSVRSPDGSRLGLLWTAQHQALLADVFPVLENMGLRIADHRRFDIRPAGSEPIRVEEFQLIQRDSMSLADGRVQRLLEEAFTAIWNGEAGDDGFNRLLLAAHLGWREVAVLRCIYAYLRQAGRPFSQGHVERTLVTHREAARLLVAMFAARFDPSRDGDGAGDGAGAGAENEVRRQFLEEIQSVDNLNEDRVLRAALAFVDATVRTNYFCRDDASPKPYLVCKLDPTQLPFLPAPRPAVETFVYSPRMEGLHLRAALVARGGIRWSDRPEDYRDEVLALMKAQMMKNAVIVPHGAKGAFVVKRPPALSDQDALAAEVRDCYATFIRGLLDVTDNQVDGLVTQPAQVVCLDGPDPYLVVAADKGTATFSDLANSIAAEYGYWLGDAFASGGSTGYDHKALGITARGVWESVRRHFGELGIRADHDELTAVGIGDMSGDVFGNGMLHPNLKLVAAFDHRHVFLDPDPDPAVAYDERRRLFSLDRSSWADFDTALISPGGGVFPRTAKSVALSPQVRDALGIDAESLPADELIRAVLRAPVDLLFNGGVGTYVKATGEHNAEVHDRANEAVRVDARELRARVVAEGGNSGLTQQARIEYALMGGRVNTDFIDNSAGVDTSDREVNIKILLDVAVASGRLTRPRRDQLLAEVSDEVTTRVLRDSYLQAQAISVTETLGSAALDRQEQFMRSAEASGLLDRTLEALPDADAIVEREKAGVGLTRPEIAVLLAYGKNQLRERLVSGSLLDEPYLADEIGSYLPEVLETLFPGLVTHHPLRRSLLAAVLTNEVHNRAGAGMLLRLDQLSGETDDLIRAWVAARDLLDLRTIWSEIDALDLATQALAQARLLIDTRRAAEQMALWLLRNRHQIDPPGEMAECGAAMRELADALPQLVHERLRASIERGTASLVASGAPRPLAERVVLLDLLPSGMDIVEITHAAGRELRWTASLYYALTGHLDLEWLGMKMAERRGESHWTQLAKASLRDDYLTQLRRLTVAAMQQSDAANSPASTAEAWLTRNHTRVQSYRQTLASLKQVTEPDVSMLSVAMQELRILAQAGGWNAAELGGLSPT